MASGFCQEISDGFLPLRDEGGLDHSTSSWKPMSVEEALTPIYLWLPPGYCRKDFVKLMQVPRTFAVVKTQSLNGENAHLYSLGYGEWILLCKIMWWLVAIVNWHNVKSLGKRVSGRNCLNQIGLRSQLWGLSYVHGCGKIYPLWATPFPRQGIQNFIGVGKSAEWGIQASMNSGTSSLCSWL